MQSNPDFIPNFSKHAATLTELPKNINHSNNQQNRVQHMQN